MGRARHGSGPALIAPSQARRPPGIATGLFGGSFNPAHRGHRRISLGAIAALDLAELWWLVSPGNPLKAAATDMAPIAARLASARAMARRSRIRVTDVEARLGTRYTVDTVRALLRQHPRRRFIWIMGADTIADFHRWRDWRALVRLLPIAIVARPGYDGLAAATPAAAWLRRFVHRRGNPADWTNWRAPALVLLHFRPDPTSATAIRRRDPDWHRAMAGIAARSRRSRLP